MCSTYLPFECGYEQSQVFDCPTGASGKPVTKQQCGEGRCTAAIKCDEDCKCKDSSSVSSRAFLSLCSRCFAPFSFRMCSLTFFFFFFCNCRNAERTLVPRASMFQARSTLVQAQERHQWKARLADLLSCAIPLRVLASASANASARLMNRYVSP